MYSTPRKTRDGEKKGGSAFLPTRHNVGWGALRKIMDFYMISIIFVITLVGTLMGLYIGLSIQNFSMHRKFRKLKKNADKEAKTLYPNENRMKGRKKLSLSFLEKKMKRRLKKDAALDDQEDKFWNSNLESDNTNSEGHKSSLLDTVSLFFSRIKRRKKSPLSRLDIEENGYISEKCGDYGIDVQKRVSESLSTQDESYAVCRDRKKNFAEPKKEEKDDSLQKEKISASHQEEGPNKSSVLHNPIKDEEPVNERSASFGEKKGTSAIVCEGEKEEATTYRIAKKEMKEPEDMLGDIKEPEDLMDILD